MVRLARSIHIRGSAGIDKECGGGVTAQSTAVAVSGMLAAVEVMGQGLETPCCDMSLKMHNRTFNGAG